MTTRSPAFANLDTKITQAPSLDEIRSWGATCDVRDAARAIGISKSTAYEWIRMGEFPAAVISVRGKRRVITADLVRLLSQTVG